jgi:predicted RNase H-like HicB family nuclease
MSRMKLYSIEVKLDQQEDGLWRAEVPGLDGCFVDGARLEGVLNDIQEVASMFVDLYRERGLQLPPSVKLSSGPHLSAVLPIVAGEHLSKTPRARSSAPART